MTDNLTPNRNAAIYPALVPTGHHTGKPPIPLSRPVMLVGSRGSAHLHLISSTVSKAHALLIISDGRVYIRDLASRTQVIVNGKAVRETDLAAGDQLKIGSFSFKVKIPSAWKTTVRKPKTKSVQLLIDGEAYRLDDRVALVGRRRTCDIALMEESVSTAHAVFVEMGGRRFVRDLGSRTGTFVNGQKIHQQEIRPGDKIRIGDTNITLEEAPTRPTGPVPVEAAAAAALMEPSLEESPDLLAEQVQQELEQGLGSAAGPATVPPEARAPEELPPLDLQADAPVAEPDKIPSGLSPEDLMLDLAPAEAEIAPEPEASAPDAPAELPIAEDDLLAFVSDAPEVPSPIPPPPLPTNESPQMEPEGVQSSQVDEIPVAEPVADESPEMDSAGDAAFIDAPAAQPVIPPPLPPVSTSASDKPIAIAPDVITGKAIAPELATAPWAQAPETPPIPEPAEAVPATPAQPPLPAAPADDLSLVDLSAIDLSEPIELEPAEDVPADVDLLADAPLPVEPPLPAEYLAQTVADAPATEAIVAEPDQSIAPPPPSDEPAGIVGENFAAPAIASDGAIFLDSEHAAPMPIGEQAVLDLLLDASPDQAVAEPAQTIESVAPQVPGVDEISAADALHIAEITSAPAPVADLSLALPGAEVSSAGPAFDLDTPLVDPGHAQPADQAVVDITPSADPAEIAEVAAASDALEIAGEFPASERLLPATEPDFAPEPDLDEASPIDLSIDLAEDQAQDTRLLPAIPSDQATEIPPTLSAQIVEPPADPLDAIDLEQDELDSTPAPAGDVNADTVAEVDLESLGEEPSSSGDAGLSLPVAGALVAQSPSVGDQADRLRELARLAALGEHPLPPIDATSQILPPPLPSSISSAVPLPATGIDPSTIHEDVDGILELEPVEDSAASIDRDAPSIESPSVAGQSDWDLAAEPTVEVQGTLPDEVIDALPAEEAIQGIEPAAVPTPNLDLAGLDFLADLDEPAAAALPDAGSDLLADAASAAMSADVLLPDALPTDAIDEHPLEDLKAFAPHGDLPSAGDAFADADRVTNQSLPPAEAAFDLLADAIDEDAAQVIDPQAVDLEPVELESTADQPSVDLESPALPEVSPDAADADELVPDDDLLNLAVEDLPEAPAAADVVSQVLDGPATLDAPGTSDALASLDLPADGHPSLDAPEPAHSNESQSQIMEPVEPTPESAQELSHADDLQWSDDLDLSLHAQADESSLSDTTLGREVSALGSDSPEPIVEYVSPEGRSNESPAIAVPAGEEPSQPLADPAAALADQQLPSSEDALSLDLPAGEHPADEIPADALAADELALDALTGDEPVGDQSLPVDSDEDLSAVDLGELNKLEPEIHVELPPDAAALLDEAPAVSSEDPTSAQPDAFSSDVADDPSHGSSEDRHAAAPQAPELPHKDQSRNVGHAGDVVVTPLPPPRPRLAPRRAIEPVAELPAELIEPADEVATGHHEVDVFSNFALPIESAGGGFEIVIPEMEELAAELPPIPAETAENLATDVPAEPPMDLVSDLPAEDVAADAQGAPVDQPETTLAGNLVEPIEPSELPDESASIEPLIESSDDLFSPPAPTSDAPLIDTPTIDAPTSDTLSSDAQSSQVQASDALPGDALSDDDDLLIEPEPDLSSLEFLPPEPDADQAALAPEDLLDDPFAAGAEDFVSAGEAGATAAGSVSPADDAELFAGELLPVEESRLADEAKQFPEQVDEPAIDADEVAADDSIASVDQASHSSEQNDAAQLPEQIDEPAVAGDEATAIASPADVDLDILEILSAEDVAINPPEADQFATIDPGQLIDQALFGEDAAPTDDAAPAEDPSPIAQGPAVEDAATDADISFAQDASALENTSFIAEPSPAEEVSSIDPSLPAEELSPADDDSPVDDDSAVEEISSVEEALPAEQITAAEEALPVDEVLPVDEALPGQELSAAIEALALGDALTAEDVTPIDGATPVDEASPTDEPSPLDDASPADEPAADSSLSPDTAPPFPDSEPAASESSPQAPQPPAPTAPRTSPQVLFPTLPAGAHTPRSRRKLFNTPLLLLLMLVLIGAAAGVIYGGYVSVTGSVIGRLKFANAASLSVRDQGIFWQKQGTLLLDESRGNGTDPVISVRQAALAALAKADGSSASAGFLGDAAAYRALAVTWQNALTSESMASGELVIRMDSNDPRGDALRVLALLTAIHSRNAQLVDEYNRIEGELKEATRQQQEIQPQLLANAAKLEELGRDSVSAVTEQELAALKNKITALSVVIDEQTHQIDDLVAGIRLLEIQTSPAATQQAAPAATVNPEEDAQLKVLQQQAADLAKQLDQQRTADSVVAQQARTELDDAFKKLQDQLKAMQAQGKDSPEMANYVKVAKLIQDNAQDLTEQLIKSQTELNTGIANLKQKLEERMEARRKELWANDSELGNLNQLLAYYERSVNAAKADASLLPPEQVQQQQQALDDVRKKIDARREQLAQDGIFVQAAKDLQELIDANTKRLATDRQLVAQKLTKMQKDLSDAAPAVASLPAEQKAMAEAMEKRLAELNAARLAYSKAIDTASTDQSPPRQQLEQKLATMRAQLEGRRQELTAQQQRIDQEKDHAALLKQLEARRATLVTLQGQRKSNEADLSQLRTQYASQSLQRTQAMEASASREQIKRQTDQLQKSKSELTQKIQSLTAQKAAAVYPQPVDRDSVREVVADDPRHKYMVFSMIGAIGLFAPLMLLSTLSATRHRIAHERELAASRRIPPAADPTAQPDVAVAQPAVSSTVASSPATEG